MPGKKHCVLAPRYGQPLPTIDWSADSSTVLTTISHLEDEAVRDILDKEFLARTRVADSLVSAEEKARVLAEKRALAREVAKNLDPKILDGYAGEYEIEQLGITLIVSRVQDGLTIQQSGEAPGELLPLSETRFFLVVGIDVYDVEFTIDKTNQVTGMVLTVYGQSYTASRK